MFLVCLPYLNLTFFISRSCSFLFRNGLQETVSGNVCVCLLAFGGPSPHFLVSFYLKIGFYRNINRNTSIFSVVHHKVCQTNQFSDCPCEAWRKRDIVAQIWGRSSLRCHWARSWLGKVTGFLWVSGICWAIEEYIYIITQDLRITHGDDNRWGSISW